MARMDANQRRHTQRCPVAGVASKRGYARHRPEDTVLYQVVECHAGPFFDSLSEQGASLPGFVREEFDAYLRCGRLEHGFVRAKCERCRYEHLAPFSCKRRGYAKYRNMLSRRWPRWYLGGMARSRPWRMLRCTSHIRHPLREAISLSGGRNLPGRSWGGVADPRTSIRCVMSTRR